MERSRKSERERETSGKQNQEAREGVFLFLVMPHVNGSDVGDDMGDADEVKVFQHDEECEEEKKLIAEERQSDSLTEDKSSLITEGESQVKKKKKRILFFFFSPVVRVSVRLAPETNPDGVASLFF